MSSRLERTVNDLPALALIARGLAKWDGAPFPLRIVITPLYSAKTPEQNKALHAHFRDIARWRQGSDVVPEREIEKVKEDFKRTDIWPRYSDPEPDYFTGEVLYRPKSCADLTAIELGTVMRWLDHYMAENRVPSHAPKDRWAA